MNNADFWASIHSIIAEGFTSEGLLKLDCYAEQFISGKLVYQRFSPQEQHGCAAGGATNVIASLLAGAEAGSDSQDSSALSDYQRECQLGAQQESVIERWAKAVGVWTDGVDEQLPKVLGEQIAEGGEAKVYDHGSTLRDKNGEFKIIVEQPFIDGQPVSDEEIADYMRQMGFELKNPRNWTYATPDIYLSDMHDENVIRSNKSNTIFVVDCDIRINVPELRQGGTRQISNIVFVI